MLLYHRAEQTLSVLCTYLVLILREVHFHTSVENSSLSKQVQSCVEHKLRSAVAIRNLFTAKVDEFLYSFNWYTIYEDCQLHPRFGVSSWATITLSSVEQQRH